jgi:hypothetical protein
LAIADDQLTLTAANGHQRVDGLDAGLHGLAHGLARDNARGLDTDTGAHVALDGALTKGERKRANIRGSIQHEEARVPHAPTPIRRRRCDGTLPSMALPRASTTRPKRPMPDGTQQPWQSGKQQARAECGRVPFNVQLVYRWARPRWHRFA